MREEGEELGYGRITQNASIIESSGSFGTNRGLTSSKPGYAFLRLS